MRRLTHVESTGGPQWANGKREQRARNYTVLMETKIHPVVQLTYYVQEMNSVEDASFPYYPWVSS